MSLLNPTTAALRLVGLLREKNLKIVFAESCTGGLAAAKMTGVPGVSNYFCGSAVTYRIATKDQWLGIDADLINAHTAESPETSLAMAIGILDRTPEADLSVAITGHLGPDAPPEKDGLIYVAIAKRTPDGRTTNWRGFALASFKRAERQEEAARVMLDYVISSL